MTLCSVVISASVCYLNVLTSFCMVHMLHLPKLAAVFKNVNANVLSYCHAMFSFNALSKPALIEQALCFVSRIGYFSFV